MASGAATGRARGVTDLLVMAAGAGARRIVVRCMAGRAGGVLLGREHGLIAMARRARRDLRGAEIVRSVTTRAGLVARRDRLVIDPDRGARLLRVTALASLVSLVLGLVDAMTIHAAARAGVPGRLLGMTRGARPGIERRGLVGAVAVAAGFVGVRADRVDLSLCPVVAAKARRRLATIGTEPVAVPATRAARRRVQRRHDICVTPRAELGRRGGKATLAVAVRARGLAEMRGVPRAGANVAVRRRHLFRRARRVTIGSIGTTEDGDDRDGDGGDRADHGFTRAPIG
jgi:hypothetical protein